MKLTYSSEQVQDLRRRLSNAESDRDALREAMWSAVLRLETEYGKPGPHIAAEMRAAIAKVRP